MDRQGQSLANSYSYRSVCEKRREQTNQLARQADAAQLLSQAIMPYRVKCFLHIEGHCGNAPLACLCQSEQLSYPVYVLGRLFVLKVSALPVVEEAGVIEMILHLVAITLSNNLPSVLSRLIGR